MMCEPPVGVEPEAGTEKLGVPADTLALDDEEQIDPRFTGPARADELWRIRTRRRWAELTKDLDRYCRDWGSAAEDGDAEESTAQSSSCRLDVPPPEMQAELHELRMAGLTEAYTQLAWYDSSEDFRDRMDDKFTMRDRFEEKLRDDALQKMRKAIKRHCARVGATSRGVLAGRSAPPRATAGREVWRVVGGKKDGGIIVRGDFPSAKVTGRLSSEALVEELASTKDRLQYRLLSGNGPSTGWVSLATKVDGEQKPLVQKLSPEEAKAAMDALSRTGPRVPVLMVGLMAVHISTDERLERLRWVLESVAKQDVPQSDAEFLFVASWSASTAELEEKVGDVISVMRSHCRSGIEVVDTKQEQRRSQFQHLKLALAAAEDHLRQGLPAWQQQAWGSAWVIFGDDDDIWHKRRISETVQAIRAHQLLDGVAAFATTARAMCNEDKVFTDNDMPTDEAQVDAFLRCGNGKRLDDEPLCNQWNLQYLKAGPDAALLSIPKDMGLEYFDFCPRLRLMHEFFGRTSPRFLEHRYCDLRLVEFLSSYPRMGLEYGLEVSFFRPRCWMLFYATPVASQKQWERVVERDGAGKEEEHDGQLQLDVNNGHMSSKIEVQPAEQELAERMITEFREYEPQMTVSRLACYWAAFRNSLECYLTRKHGLKTDQRMFDTYVFLAVSSSFYRFWDLLQNMRNQRKAETGERMMYYVGQGFGKAVVLRLGVTVVWVRPDIFLGRDFYYMLEGFAVPLLGGQHHVAYH